MILEILSLTMWPITTLIALLISSLIAFKLLNSKEKRDLLLKEIADLNKLISSQTNELIDSNDETLRLKKQFEEDRQSLLQQVDLLDYSLQQKLNKLEVSVSLITEDLNKIKIKNGLRPDKNS